ncbi:MAG: RDD family protein [Bdellovibrionales bacterium]|nr:RDD family protein [Bdellovibrionales bacterium]
MGAENRYFPQGNTQEFGSGVIGLASPSDRLASLIVDAVILLPIVQLLQSPIKRWIYESMLFNELASQSALRVANSLLFVAIFVFYNTFCLWWSGQTLGKKFFSVRVISYRGRLGFVDSFLRSLSIFIEMLLLGLPFMAIFTHELRRPIHDRVGDTLVISLKSPIGYPSLSEKRKAWVTAAVSLIAIMFIGSLYFILSLSQLDVAAIEKSKCDKALVEVGHDLEASFELFVVGQIKEECLRNRAKDALWLGDQSALANLALAFSHSKDHKKSNDYLKQVCLQDEESMSCAFSRWVEASPLKSQATSDESEGMLMNMDLPPALTIYFASTLASQKQWSKVLTLLGDFHPNSQLRLITARILFTALLATNSQKTALWVFKSHNLKPMDFLMSYDKAFEHPQKNHLTLLEKFYPRLKNLSGRSIASADKVPMEIRVLYRILQEIQ